MKGNILQVLCLIHRFFKRRSSTGGPSAGLIFSCSFPSTDGRLSENVYKRRFHRQLSFPYPSPIKIKEGNVAMDETQAFEGTDHTIVS